MKHLVNPFFLSFGLAACLLALPGTARSENQAEVFEQKTTQTLRLDYLLSLPEGYDANAEKKWPLMVFLHGSGERGNTLSRVAKHGPPKRVAEGESFPFVLVSPQCPQDSWWSEEPILELITYIESKYHIDSDRIYLTGLSMGGYGTWDLAARAPDRFAAIVPICGGGIPYRMRRLVHMPIWVFHGGKDSTVPLQESERLVDALKKAGNVQTKFTIYPEANHDSWTEAYSDPELYKWLLSQSRPPKDTAPTAESEKAKSK